MAIDTREKRQAASVVSSYWMAPSPTPIAAKDQEWRQEAGWGYPGILADFLRSGGGGARSIWAEDTINDFPPPPPRRGRRMAGALGRRRRLLA